MHLRQFFTNFENESVSLEALDGNAVQEIEYMFFGKLEDFSQLERADKIERQEQWEVRTPLGGVRVRRCEAEGEVTYILTSKVKREGEKGKEEVETEVTADMFEHFKLHASTGMRKDRHCFNVPDSELVWELDVFYSASGDPVPWVKIDLEVPGEIALPQWPVEFSEVITNQNGKRSDEEQAIVGDLFENHYILKPTQSPNPFDAVTKELFKGIVVPNAMA